MTKIYMEKLQTQGKNSETQAKNSGSGGHSPLTCPQVVLKKMPGLIPDFENRKRPQDSADCRISEGGNGNGSNGGGVKRPPESQLKKIPDNNKIPKWLSKGKQ